MSNSFAPRYLDIRALMPTAVPTPKAIIIDWIGKQSEVAVSASSLICATKMLSTMLYSASTNIDTISGTDNLIISDGIGAVPSLFSFSLTTALIFLPS